MPSGFFLAVLRLRLKETKNKITTREIISDRLKANHVLAWLARLESSDTCGRFLEEARGVLFEYHTFRLIPFRLIL